MGQHLNSNLSFERRICSESVRVELGIRKSCLFFLLFMNDLFRKEIGHFAQIIESKLETEAEPSKDQWWHITPSLIFFLFKKKYIPIVARVVLNPNPEFCPH